MAAPEKSMGLLLGLDESKDDAPLGGEDEAEPVEDTEMAAAQDLIDAVNSGSAAAVKAALRASYDACSATSMSDDEL